MVWVNSSTGKIYVYRENEWQLIVMDIDDITNLLTRLTSIQTELDDKAQTYYQEEDPSIPWDNTLKPKHLGDLWYKISNKKGYMYSIEDTVYYWREIPIPQELLDKVDGKKSIYKVKPSNYAESDLWILESDAIHSPNKQGEILVAQTSNISYNANDWVALVKYTHDSVTEGLSELLNDIADDSKLTANEKQIVKKEFDIITSEKSILDTQADLFSVSKTDYDAKYTTLNEYLAPFLEDLTITSDITRATFITNFKNYNDSKMNLINALADKAKSVADSAQSAANSAQSSANTAQSSANTAQSLANAAQSGADTANGVINGWGYDEINSEIDGAKVHSISADKIYSGTYKVGGLNNQNGIIEVYDSNNVKTGTFNKDGVELNTGDFTIIEDDIKCTLLNLPNLLNDHSFELIKIVGNVDETYNDYESYTTNTYLYEWNKVNNPKIVGSVYSTSPSVSKFDKQMIVVNSTDKFEQYIMAKSNTEYVITSYVMRYLRNPLAGTPRITIDEIDMYTNPQAPAILNTRVVDLTINTEQLNWKRVGCYFTSISNVNLSHIRITLGSTDTNYVYYDGIQMLEDNIPCLYNPESKLWNTAVSLRDLQGSYDGYVESNAITDYSELNCDDLYGVKYEGYGNDMTNSPSDNGYFRNIPSPILPQTYNMQEFTDVSNCNRWVRVMEDGVFSAWKRFTISFDVSYKGVVDLNDMKSAGIYGVYSCTNAPNSAIGILEVLVYSADWIIQRYTTISDSPIKYERAWHSGTTWSSWKLTTTDINGWNSAEETWIYSSVDNPTGVISISGNKTTKYSPGMRIQFSNGGNTIFGKITKSVYSAPNTLISFLHEINPGTNQALYLLANSAITNNYYSLVHAPYGFPMNKSKWRLIGGSTGSQTNPVQNTWYNKGGNIVLHPGSWDTEYDTSIYETHTGGDQEVQVTLSTTNNGETDVDLRNGNYITGIGESGSPLHRRKNITVTDKTTYYRNMRTTKTNVTLLYDNISGASGTITATLDY